MKKIFAMLAIATISTVGCRNATEPAGQNVPVTRREINSEVVKTVATLSIEGMTCSSGCGGKIQQELRAMAGVNNTELDYADNRAANSVLVEYIPSRVNEQQLIACVNAVADGKYKVKSVEILQYKGLQGTGGGAAGDADVTSNNYLTDAFQLFNLVQSLLKVVE
ncbi:MAG: heavy-metal-associated domain-containing protein [Flavobacteriales bacterium]